jgi:hypothetical protein
LLGIVIARAQINAADTRRDGRLGGSVWQSRGTVVVAYPIDCDGRPNQPVAIRWSTRMNAPVSPAIIADRCWAASNDPARRVAVPDGAMVVSLRNAIMVSATVKSITWRRRAAAARRLRRCR